MQQERVSAPVRGMAESAGRSWVRFSNLGPIIGLVLLCLAGTVLNPDFATFDNAMSH